MSINTRIHSKIADSGRASFKVRFARVGCFYFIPKNCARTQPNKKFHFFPQGNPLRKIGFDGTWWYWHVPWCSLKVAVTRCLSGVAFCFLGCANTSALPTQVAQLPEATELLKGFCTVDVKDVQDGPEGMFNGFVAHVHPNSDFGRSQLDLWKIFGILFVFFGWIVRSLMSTWRQHKPRLW